MGTDTEWPYWAPLQLQSVRSGCSPTTGTPGGLRPQSDAELNASLQKSHCDRCSGNAPFLLPSDAPFDAHQGVQVLVSHIVHCETVGSCSFAWSFLALVFGGQDHALRQPDRQNAWQKMWEEFARRARVARARQVRKYKMAVRRALVARGPQPILEYATSKLVLSGHSPAFFREPHVAPFVNQFRCYATFHGMQITLYSPGTSLQHKTLLASAGLFIAAHKPVDGIITEDALLRELAGDLLAGRAWNRVSEFMELEGVIGIHVDNPEKFVKAYAISKCLPRSSIVFALDVDMTIRPDSWNAGLIDAVFHGDATEEAELPHVVVRDSWPGVECVNTGFIAARNTKIARLFMSLWQEKLGWSASWDQGALAETILELVGLEVFHRSGGESTYSSQCLPYLFPLSSGLVPLRMYCDCWQATLSDLVGPYRQRNSRIVGFVDPERVDVNYVPNDLFAGHSFDLTEMWLLPRPGRPALDPLIVHWAGTGAHRLWLMERYLELRFNITKHSSLCSQLPGSASTTARQPPLRCRARAARCCAELRRWRTENKIKPPEDVVGQYGCCASQPVTPEDCFELMGAQ